MTPLSLASLGSDTELSENDFHRTVHELGPGPARAASLLTFLPKQESKSFPLAAAPAAAPAAAVVAIAAAAVIAAAAAAEQDHQKDDPPPVIAGKATAQTVVIVIAAHIRTSRTEI